MLNLNETHEFPDEGSDFDGFTKEMSLCNYCTLLAIRRNALESEEEVTLKDREVFVHPKGVEPTKEHFVAWFMKLSDHCVC